jgi:hypothetical protein
MGRKGLDLSQGEIMELSVSCLEQTIAVVAPNGAALVSRFDEWLSLKYLPVATFGVRTWQASRLPLIPRPRSSDRVTDAVQRSSVLHAGDGARSGASFHFHNARPGLSASEQRRGASC